MNCPKIVKKACIFYDAWIIGGGARYLTGETTTLDDWDLAIPHNKWNSFCSYLKKISPDIELKLNNFGGLRFEYDNEKYDIWAGDIGETALKATRSFIAYKYSEEILIKVQK